ncbi:uncharacterized protein LOC114526763 [Dendronephthya gigantea]|uniref:uncharacterized protein LOC114526763 n=1 Tax=Dendronephthya gigantea TaxID=151771 RepID=UPI00106ACB06|nr:uncharacterized protein LOC114526763 [Dendronephthya gigantea]
MLRGFYVDDLATGEKSTERAYLLYTKARERLAEGGFNLRKWRTNNNELRLRIERENSEQNGAKGLEPTYAKTALACQGGDQVDKVLGLEWDCVGDTIKFNFGHLTQKAQSLEPSKRNVLSLLACIFDPLGLISPTVAKAKILFQDICVSGLDWDDVLSRNLREKWEKWLADLRETEEVILERYGEKRVGDRVSTGGAKHWLHGFGDASKRAYCAIVYLVTIESGKAYVKLIASKTRVAPLKELTIPRLELMAARILAQLMHAVKNTLESEYKFEGIRYWTDSKTTLCWIRNTGEWKQFVRHRVDEVLKLTNKLDWGHCPGKENPADLGSRGVLVSELKNSKLWWLGPGWLTGSPSDWPQLGDILPTPESKREEKKLSVNLMITVDSLYGISNLIKVNKFSSLTRLLRVTGWLKRFVANLKRKKAGESIVNGTLHESELREAEVEWIKVAQLVLKDQTSYSQLERQYGLIERDGILYCTGRLGKSDLDIEAREPIVLPKGHIFTKLVIKCCHDYVLHNGVRSTLAQLRSKYWVPQGRQEVKRVLATCVICKKWKCKPCTKPRQAALPRFRVTKSAPFANSGVDFAGPLFVKAKYGKSMNKVYIALFTCCVTRAVHLELVENLKAPTFLRCFRRFVGRRGTPKIMASDNAKTFKASKRILRDLFDNVEVEDCLSNKGIDWRFNLERAPWWGGFFERLVGVVKTCLRKVIGSAKLTFDELRTILVEVEATVNDRPLT